LPRSYEEIEKMKNDLLSHNGIIKDVFPETPTTNTYLLQFEDKQLQKKFTWTPGQFLMLSLLGIGEAALSISNTPLDGPITTTVRTVGNVTNKIGGLKKGKKIGIRGPYGTGWPLKEIKGKNVLIVAGGMGLAPLRGVIRYISHKRKNYGHLEIIYGARNLDDMIYKNQYEDWRKIDNSNLHLTVDTIPPGLHWDGKIGLVTSCFPIMDTHPHNSVALVCGPEIMMRYAAKCLETIGFIDDQIYLSLERRMKCGIGKCGHCQVGPKYVCNDGPVFSYSDVKPYIYPL
jgi:NAD(P)H-flavin reductase